MNQSFINNIGSNINDFIYIGDGYSYKEKKMQSLINNQIYIVKIIKKTQKYYDNIKLYRERVITSHIFHNNIVNSYTSFEDNENCYIISEFFQGNTLSKLVESKQIENMNKFGENRASYLSQDLIIYIFEQILNGLIYLHQNKIFHRDIRPENILIDANYNVKINNFELAAMYEKGFERLATSNTIIGNSGYVAPEILANKEYDFKCDIFSLGHTMYYLMNFELPDKKKVAYNKRLSLQITMQNYDSNLISLVIKMFSEDPNDRPTALQAYNELQNIKNKIYRLNNNNINNVNFINNTNNINNIIYNVKNYYNNTNLYNNNNFYHNFNTVDINNNIMNQNIGNSLSDFENIKDIGKGCFGEVKKMKSKINNEIYAIKIIKKSSIKTEYDLKKLTREKFIMSNLNHPNIVRLFNFFEDNNNFYFCSEFIDGKNLEIFSKEYQDNKTHIKEKLLINIFKQILNGLIYLHDKNIMHRDIKPDNILIDGNNNIKITDFGISACYGDNSILGTNLTVVGPKKFASPEIKENKEYDLKCDIYSLGCTMFYLMNFFVPSLKSLPSNLDSSGSRIRSGTTPIYQGYDPKLTQLANELMNYDPQKRPTARQALNKLVEIEKRKNYIFKKFNQDNFGISSLKYILHCLYGLENMNFIRNIIRNKVQNEKDKENYFPYIFNNILDIIEMKNKNEISEMKYNEFIKSFSNELLSKNKFKGNTPIIFYNNILTNFTSEFSNLINWNNMMFSQYDKPIEIPEDKYTQIYEEITKFQEKNISPLVDIFSFIILIINDCPNCHEISNIEINSSTYLDMKDLSENTINKLLKNYFEEKKCKNILFTCPCGFSGNQYEKKVLFNSPKYLVLNTEGISKINFDEYIDINPFVRTNVGPKRYELYAVINREKSEFIASIKENDNWISYKDDSRQECLKENINDGEPSLVIYKGY